MDIGTIAHYGRIIKGYSPIIGALALLVSVIGTGIAIIGAIRKNSKDKPIIRIRGILTPADSDGSSKRKFCIEVLNEGRRPIQIIEVGIFVGAERDQKPFRKLSDSLSNPLPFELKENHKAAFVPADEEFRAEPEILNKVTGVWVRSAPGKIYKGPY